MTWPHLIADFFGGAVLFNAIPHTVAGLQGKAFQTPFAKPPGEGLSSSRLNVVWGLANWAIAYLLLIPLAHLDLADGWQALALGLGALALGLPLSAHFGRFNGGNAPAR